MNGRLLAVALTVFLFALLNGALLIQERTEGYVLPDEKSKAEARKDDWLVSIRYQEQDREGNLKKFGFEDAEVKKILARISDLAGRYRVKDPQADIVTARIDASEDDGLESAFCGAGETLPVRYGAMAYLIEEKGTALRPVDLEQIASFEYQDWATNARIQAAYAEAELTDDRKTDSVRMVMAAILARDEETLLQHDSPWGRGVFAGGWSWEGVKKKHPGVTEHVVNYVAILHLVLEVARAEGGLCAS